MSGEIMSGEPSKQPHKHAVRLLLRLGLGFIASIPFAIGGLFLTRPYLAEAQSAGSGRVLTLRADVQEANAKTGIVTARGNVQINYPARQIQATAAQAQYFSRERRIVLTGNVYVLQQGNSMRGENITYLIDEGRFVALPDTNRQVEATYLVTDPDVVPAPTANPGPPPFTPSTGTR